MVKKKKYIFTQKKDSSLVRNNPLGLAEPSVKRDGYAVGSREGSMYRRFLKGKKRKVVKIHFSVQHGQSECEQRCGREQGWI